MRFFVLALLTLTPLLASLNAFGLDSHAVRVNLEEAIFDHGTSVRAQILEADNGDATFVLTYRHDGYRINTCDAPMRGSWEERLANFMRAYAVFVVGSQEEQRALPLPMNRYCPDRGDHLGFVENGARLIIKKSEQPELWEQLFPLTNTEERSYNLEVAFAGVRVGQRLTPDEMLTSPDTVWDSRYGKNYHLNLK